MTGAAPAAPLELELDVVSDFMCPWCFVGSLRLAAALIRVRRAFVNRELTISVRWRPYFLVPGLTRTLDKRAMYAKKLGDAAKVDRMAAQFGQMLAPFGERYRVDGAVGSTLRAHRLTAWVGQRLGDEAQWRLANELFRAYHSRGRNLDEPSVLLTAYREAGLQEESGDSDAAVLSFLESTELEEQVKAETPALGLETLTGVPHVRAKVIGGASFEIPGAQDVDYTASILQRMLSNQSKL